MNILFVSSIKNYDKLSIFNKLIYKLFGFCFNSKFDETRSLMIDSKRCNKKILKLFLRHLYSNEPILVVPSKYTEGNWYKEVLEKPIIVSEQNNLLKNDDQYIKDYIKKNNIAINEVKVLVVIDELTDVIKEKVKELIYKYKIVDIYTKRKATYFFSLDFAQEINKELGSNINILDKDEFVHYNILLVFSHKPSSLFYSNRAYVLDYHNSDQDIGSNTFKMYLQNKEKLKNLFEMLQIDLNDFQKTKLGKLCIHKKW